jgi:hypothetical protein
MGKGRGGAGGWGSVLTDILTRKAKAVVHAVHEVCTKAVLARVWEAKQSAGVTENARLSAALSALVFGSAIGALRIWRSLGVAHGESSTIWKWMAWSWARCRKSR